MPAIGKGGRVVSFDFPLRGYDDSSSNTGQKKGTTSLQLNCLPYDAIQHRARGGQRAGVDRFLADPIIAKNVLGLLQVTLGQSPASPDDAGVVPFGSFVDNFGVDESAVFDSGDALRVDWSTRQAAFTPAWKAYALSANVAGKEFGFEDLSTTPPAGVFDQIGDSYMPNAGYLTNGNANVESRGGLASAVSAAGGALFSTLIRDSTLTTVSALLTNGVQITGQAVWLGNAEDSQFGVGIFKGGDVGVNNAAPVVPFGIRVMRSTSPSNGLTVCMPTTLINGAGATSTITLSDGTVLTDSSPGWSPDGFSGAQKFFALAAPTTGPSIGVRLHLRIAPTGEFELEAAVFDTSDFAASSNTILVQGTITSFATVFGTLGASKAAMFIQGRRGNAGTIAANAMALFTDLVDTTYTPGTADPDAGLEPRTTKLVAAAGQRVWLGDTDGLTQIGSDTALNKHKPRLTELNRHVYIVDREHTLDLDVVGASISNLTAAGGKGTVPAGCAIAVTWRGRLVLSSQDADPENVFMSRVGDPTDWLYGQDDANSAFEMNTGDAGHVGDIVLALVPYKDDTLIIGGDHTIHALQGDPAESSGQLVALSKSIGMHGQEAWCADPSGTIYFLGTGGFYKMAGDGSIPKNLSAGSVNEFFAGINRRTTYAECEYDRDRHQVWIFITTIATGESTHLVYDVRTDSFWRQRFTDAIGPMCSMIWDGDGPLDRYMLLGGRDGVIRKLNPAVVDDDGTAFSSFVQIGPVQPAGNFDDAMFTQWDIVPAEGTTKLDVYVMRGRDVETASDATQELLITCTAGGRQRKLTRFRDNCFFLYLHNRGEAFTWAIEQIQALALPVGIQRS